MPIPAFEPNGWLPSGDWDATLEEVEARFGAVGPQRRRLMAGLVQVVEFLDSKGVDGIWLDGSFIGVEHRPSDVDVLYMPPVGQNIHAWGLYSPAQRKALKTSLHVDLWQWPS